MFFYFQDHVPLMDFGKTEYVIEIDNGTCQNSADENDNDYQSETCIINYSESDEEVNSMNHIICCRTSFVCLPSSFHSLIPKTAKPQCLFVISWPINQMLQR